MKFLVTGGAGFFGTWIIKNLLSAGDEVYVFDVEVYTKRWELIMNVSGTWASRYYVTARKQTKFL